MSSRLSGGARLGRWLAGGSALIGAVCTVALLLVAEFSPLMESFLLHSAVIGVGFGALAWAVYPSQSSNRTIWALTAAAALSSLSVAAAMTGILITRASIPDWSLADMIAQSPSELPFSAAVAIQPTGWFQISAFLLVVTVVLQLFPEGEPVSPRWRWLTRLSLGLLVVMAVPFGIVGNPWSTVPIGSQSYPGVAGAIIDELTFPAVVFAVLSIVSLVVRYRRGTQETRQQIRWIALAGLAMIVSLVAASSTVGFSILLVTEVGLITAFALAITRYNLYAVDIVISKVVTYGSLVILIGLLYAASVFAFIFTFRDETQRATGDLGIALPIGATLVVALAFEPLRERLQRWANRLVYGERAAPAEVLSQLAGELDDASIAGDLAGLADLLRRGTAAESAAVWLRIGDRFRAVAASPPTTEAAPEVDSIADFQLSNVTLAVPVSHGGETLGALEIEKSRAHVVTPADRDLLGDVSAGAGLLLRNLRLNEELADRARQLEASRRRLVATQDSVRHRLERDLHDGAQQQVVALKVKLGLAKALAGREGVEGIAQHLDRLATETDQAIEQMRRIARGIYPPLLEAEGLATALGAAERTFDRPVQVDLNGVGRYDRAIEQTVYFGAITAIAASFAGGATSARVAIEDTGDHLSVVVTSDSSGPLDVTGLVDRIEAMGGSLEERPMATGIQLVAVIPLASIRGEEPS